MRTSKERDRSRVNILLLLVMGVIALNAVAFVADGPAATALRMGILALSLIALVAAVSTHRHGDSRRGLVVGAVTACSFITAISLAFTVAQQASAASAANDSVGKSTSQSGVLTGTVEYSRPDLDQIAAGNESLEELSGSEKTALIEKARDNAYHTESGAEQSWEKAQAYHRGELEIVNVPLASEMGEVNKVVYVWDGSSLNVQEIYGTMVDAQTVNVKVWNNGELQADRKVVNSKPEVNTYGVNWTTLNDCLNSIGINWAVLAVISVACAVACAGTAGTACIVCISGQAGWTGGSIGACVKNAWQ